MIYTVYFSDGGVPKTGLSPTWETLEYTDGVDTTNNPTITEIGGGWYGFDITLGDAAGPWKLTTKDLVGVVDGGSELLDVERYKPVAITLRGLALAKIAHKGVQNLATKGLDIYAADGTTKEVTFANVESSSELTRTPGAPSE